MLKRPFLSLLIFISSLTAVYLVYAQMGRGMMQSMVRHHYIMRYGISEKYRGKSNPIALTEENLAKGKQLYSTFCTACHGSKGYGDGPAGKSLNPRPANLSSTVNQPMTTDSFLLWTISEGGTAFKTAMPPFKEAISEEDIWKIILYLYKL
ncbi:MAG: cytochrome c [SAR324 cluster bacterium]|nr:cytochrome c [SAR324 cluster bacterium]